VGVPGRALRLGFVAQQGSRRGHGGQLAAGRVAGQVFHAAVRREHDALGGRVGQRPAHPGRHLGAFDRGVIEVEHPQDDRLTIQARLITLTPSSWKFHYALRLACSRDAAYWGQY
jgi:hypothetical protein